MTLSQDVVDQIHADMCQWLDAMLEKKKIRVC